MAKNLRKGFAIQVHKGVKKKHEFIMPKKYVPNQDVFFIEILKADELKWYFGLVGKIINVQDYCEENYKAIDYQDDKIYLVYMIQKTDCKVVKYE